MTDFSTTRAKFYLPDGLTYLDGNSLGALPLAAREKVSQCMADEWGKLLIKGWNDAGWIMASGLTGDRIGWLIGAPKGTVTVGDTLSLKVYQALAAALDMQNSRRVILSDTGNFPSDLYMAQGLVNTLGRGHELRMVAPEAVAGAIDDRVAVLMLTEVDYRTGRMHDMAALTKRAHDAGALVVWDLAHSAGAIEVDLTAADADFAVGCTYKYLNGGPGAPAFIYAAPRHLDRMRPALSGWLGHEATFAFDLDYRAAQGIGRMRIGTPPILALSALNAALDVFDDVSMHSVRSQSIRLSELFIRKVEERCGGVTLASPRDPYQRGSQVSFSHPDGYAVMQALIANGVIGDFRAPNLIRFGITPLYTTEADILRAVDVLVAIVNGGLWDEPEYHKRAAVT